MYQNERDYINEMKKDSDRKSFFEELFVSVPLFTLIILFFASFFKLFKVKK